MKKSFFIFFSVLTALAFFSLENVQAQSSCCTITHQDTAVKTGHHAWDYYVFYHNPDEGTYSIEVYCLSGACTSVCKTVNAKDSFIVANMQCDNAEDIAVRIYLGSSCEGTPCPPPGTLPVSLVNFTSKKQDNAVALNWQTSMEKNNSGFSIEKSTDSKSWNKIAFVPSLSPSGNSDVILNYTYLDYTKSSNSLIEYRLKQIDIDGHFVYSPVSVVRMDPQEIAEMSIYPNPSSGSVNVAFKSDDMHNLKLFDVSGRLIRNWNNTSKKVIQISNLAPGFYVLKASTPGAAKTLEKKIIVE